MKNIFMIFEKFIANYGQFWGFSRFRTFCIGFFNTRSWSLNVRDLKDEHLSIRRRMIKWLWLLNFLRIECLTGIRLGTYFSYYWYRSKWTILIFGGHKVKRQSTQDIRRHRLNNILRNLCLSVHCEEHFDSIDSA